MNKMMTREEAKEILENWNLCHYTPSREAAEMVISALDPLEIIFALRPVSRKQVEQMRGEWIVKHDYIILKEPEQAGISRLRELAQADREGRCVVLETDRKKLEIAFNIVVKYGFCQDCRWVFEDKNCLECGCYQDGAKIIKEALFGGEAALRGEQDE